MKHCLFMLCLSFAIVPSAFAQSVLLSEQVKGGEHFRCELELSVSGKLKAMRGGMVEAMTISASASHKYSERAENVDTLGGIGKAIRYYDVASSTSKVGLESTKRELAANRRLTVAVRSAERTLHFSPAGPISRDELELIAEHFDTMSLPTMLPNKEIKVGESWAISNDAAQHACLFEGIVKNELQGTLTEVQEGIATFTITGKTVGVELGAAARVSVNATGKFDVGAKRITELTWEQDDDREQGAATPATEVKAKVVLKRSVLAEEPEALSAMAREKVPGDTVPANMLMLRYADPDGKYTFNCPREWHVIGRTSEHLVLRLLDKNEFVAQATISGWEKAEAGKHTPAAEFKETVSKVMSWEPEGIVQDGELPMEEGRWMYRVAMKGKQEGVAVVQNFYLIAAANGEQAAVSVMVPQDKITKLATKDIDLLKTFEMRK